MKAHLAQSGKWLAGASGVTILGYLVATAGKHVWWPYVLLGSLFAVGVLAALIFDKERQDAAMLSITDVDASQADGTLGTDDTADAWPWVDGSPDFGVADSPNAPLSSVVPTRTPAFTQLWRYTASGIEASPVMQMANTSMPEEPLRSDRGPFVRVGVCIRCDAIAGDASSSAVGGAFVDFLGRGALSSLVSSLTHPGETVAWTRVAGNGLLRLEAVVHDERNDCPIASAMFLPPTNEMRMYGRADQIACLWLHTELGRSAGQTRRLTFADLHSLFQRAMLSGDDFRSFLESDLGLSTWDDPPAKVGVLIQSNKGIDEVVDPGPLRPLPGAVQSGQFIGYSIADRDGQDVHEAARALLRQLCDHTIHLDGFEPVLAVL